MSIQNAYLSPREEKVLKAVIEDYILSSAPIGSNFLKKKHPFKCSPATLRNVMAKLEDKNLLIHTHTSSGRIPTDVGYRYYVDHLLEYSNRTISGFENIQQVLNTNSNNVDDLLRTTAAILGKISHLFGVTAILEFDRSILNELELVSLSSDRVMVVLGMKSKLVRSVVLNLKISINDNELQNVASVLKEKLLGLSLEEIQNSIAARLEDSPLSDHEIIQILLTSPQKHFSLTNRQMVFTSSPQELFVQPEYQEVENLQQTLIAVENENVSDYFKTYLDEQDNYILIGNENMDEKYTNCTVVSNVFHGKSFQGQIGIIGPTRLPYGRIMRILNNFTEIMNNVC